MNWVICIFSLIFSYILGFTLNKGLSATNVIKNIENKKDIINYNIPFIYTVGLNEILLIVSVTIIFFLALNCYYSKSRTSKLQLFIILLKSLFIETIIFMFLIGSWGDKIIENLAKNDFFKVNIWTIILFLLSLIVFLAMIQENNTLKIRKIKIRGDLYPSREKLIKLLNFYLKSENGISIIGDWGIGKTKLIENFFLKEQVIDNKIYNFGEKYEYIYIDASSYCEVEKIIRTINNKINKILKQNKILKINKEYIDKLFLETDGLIKSIKYAFFSTDDECNQKSILKSKIGEYEKQTNKVIVLCLDNLERINNKEYIMTLLSIIDDLIPNNIKKIYLYDKIHMKTLIDNFDKYIEKYSSNEIQVKAVSTSEMIVNPEKIDLVRLTLNLRSTLEDNDDIIKGKITEIENKLTNSRYLTSLLTYAENTEIKFEFKYKVEYKLLIDVFQELNFNNKIMKAIFFPNNSYYNQKKIEIFSALNQGEIELKESIIDKNKAEIEKNALIGNGEDIVYYLDFCKSKDIILNISDFFNKIKSYYVEDYETLKTLLLLELSGEDINLNKIKIYNKKNFWNSSSKYSADASSKLVKIIFLNKYFINLKRISRLLFDNQKEFEQLYLTRPINFEQELMKLKGMTLENFIEKIKEIRLNNNFINDLIDNKVELELKVLNSIKFNENFSEDNFTSNITEEIIQEWFKSENLIRDILERDNDKLIFKREVNDKKEKIDKTNIKEYKEYFEKFKNKNDLVKDILLEIYLFEKELEKDI